MHYEEFQRQLGKAGLTIKSFADLVKMNKNSVSNYSKIGSVPAHLALIATLLAEIVELGGDIKVIVSKIKIEPKLPRGRSRQQKDNG